TKWSAAAAMSARQEVVDAREKVLLAHRLRHEVLRALAKAPHAIGLHRFRRDDEDRNRSGLRVAGKVAGCLEAVDARHDHIHDHEVGPLALDERNALLGARRARDAMAALGEHRAQRVHVGWRIIDDANVCHLIPCRSNGVVGHSYWTCRRIAPRSSSRVNGLVRYCSEPTMRPRALSNRPSFEDSMITGVPLNIWLFLISAQVW